MWQSPVTFSRIFPLPQDMPLPNSKLLTLHGVCARVAHMSGAAEYFNDGKREQRKIRQIRELASDGSSSTVLLESILARLPA